ncbi:hypothetical protein B0T22DRAFT_160351 [Podospora appendiculata]|uniref:NAD(P)-binding protein n=1 Tax=Podospora appendiculata TaxID=314037 RepID=A0AAE0X9S3_9PEZI|nr:hypothetical protein B0T22DRAFT_160351 [Podospora appendiculata]
MSPNTNNTTPKTVLITGASEGGIGNALALEFQSRGLHVFASARSLAKMANLSSLPNLTLLELDVTSPESIAAAVGLISSHSTTTSPPRLDILVNNSGQSYVSPALEIPLATSRSLFEVNFFGLLATTQAFVPLLVVAQGVIVNIGSLAGNLNIPYMSIYSASKAAVEIWGETLRVEMAPLGVRVLTVSTAMVQSKMTNGANVAAPVLSERSFWKESAAEKAAREKKANGVEREATGMLPEVYARKVVNDVLGGANGVVLRGAMATMTWFIRKLPQFVIDRIGHAFNGGRFELVDKA